MSLKVALFMVLAGLNLWNLIFKAVPVLIVSRGSMGWVRFTLCLVGLMASFSGALVNVIRSVP